LIVIAGFLIVEAFKRFLNPEPIQANIVIIFAFASVLINALSVFLLHNDAKNNMNIKSAYLHLLTDVMTSIAVMIGGLVMKYTGFVQVDSILSFLIALYLIYSSYKILTDAVRILMQAAPKNLDVQSIRNEITGLEGVSNLKNVHVWQLNEKETIFEADVYLNREMMLSEVESITSYIRDILLEMGVNQMFISPKRKNQEN
jgi:cobalt-zinc-cadmium efflux system protein